MQVPRRKMIRLRYAEEAAEIDPIAHLVGRKEMRCGCGEVHSVLEITPVVELEGAEYHYQCAIDALQRRVQSLESILEGAEVEGAT